MSKVSQVTIEAGDCITKMQKLASKSVDLVLGSPPYACKADRYQEQDPAHKFPNDPEEWVDRMLAVTVEALRVSRNIVVWVVNSSIRNGRYQPAVEMLVADAHRQGLIQEHPGVWGKNSTPWRRPYFVNRWEYVLAFRPEGSTQYFDYETVARPPKYKNGGKFRQRGSDGERREGGSYPQNKLARPDDLFYATVGGGHMGSPLAHEGEAPYPESLIHYFIEPLCPPGGVVLDPFCGSGTTLKVALQKGRKAIGFDARKSQVLLSRRRVAEVIGTGDLEQPQEHVRATEESSAPRKKKIIRIKRSQ